MSEPKCPKQWPPHWYDVTDPAVLAAMADVPRHLFVPPDYRDEAYQDRPLPIGEGQTISQPYIVALMTQALQLASYSRVLEIGTGSGYQSAILAEITPHVWSVETVPELASAAEDRLHDLGYRVEVKTDDGRFGWTEHAPFDRIIVTAASPDLPPTLAHQLADGGRLVIPVGQSTWDQTLWLVERQADDFRAQRLAEVRFVPLVSTAPESEADDPELAELRDRLAGLLR